MNYARVTDFDWHTRTPLSRDSDHPAAPTTAQRHGHVINVKPQFRGIQGCRAVGKLAEARGVAGDDSLVAGPQAGVRVVGVLKGYRVAALEPAAHAVDLADSGEEQAQLALGRPGFQVDRLPAVIGQLLGDGDER
jgi:hypothetical protein